ncbi:MAG: ATP-binding cassette domain-containing protein [Planctomycetaceae bacterium]|nr:ATP-binding cassette domain-containing protein [Planctomycetaceae bacterium]
MAKKIIKKVVHKRASVKRSKKAVPPPQKPLLLPERPDWEPGWLVLRGARAHNLKSIDVSFPLSAFTVVTGVSGSGKSTLVNDILYNALAHQLHRASLTAGSHDGIDGIERINKVIRVDQQPIGQTPTSNPATYSGLFDLIRTLFAQLPDAKVRGYTSRRFSFNVPGGRCEKCEGNGQLKIEMHFLPDVWILCDACGGKRYDSQTLEVKYRGYSISDVLELSCAGALELFQNIPNIRRILQTLCDVGLDYVALGQSAPTLSGGEAQRVKLAAELARPDTGRTLYLLDEPTTGLHFEDLQKLLDVIHRLVDLGNSVVVIEHNLDMIKSADWIIDLGPEAGLEGGHLVFSGTPEHLVRYAPILEHHSHTADVLAPVLQAGPYADRKPYNFPSQNTVRTGETPMEEIGEEVPMPWEADGRRWHCTNRISRNGRNCKWDGRILSELVDRIQESGLFAETNWNHRSIVEMTSKQKSLGWFFHALTSEEWLLKLKFRTAKNTFKRELLIQRLNLLPLNDMQDIPLYGTEPRIRVHNTRGPFQEIELKIHSYEEFDRPEFAEFLETAIRGFAKFTEKIRKTQDQLTPWKILKEKWHFTPKGYIGGSTPVWDYPLLEEVFTLLKETAPEAKIHWTNKILVSFYLPGDKKPWAAVNTKRCDGIYVEIRVPKNSVPLGKIRSIGFRQAVNGNHEDYDLVQFVFTKKSDLKKPVFRHFLKKLREC